MVHMVMGDKDAGETVEGKRIGGKVQLELTKTHSCIYQYAVNPVTKIVAVAAAPARKAHEKKTLSLFVTADSHISSLLVLVLFAILGDDTVGVPDSEFTGMGEVYASLLFVF